MLRTFSLRVALKGSVASQNNVSSAVFRSLVNDRTQIIVAGR